MREGGTLSGICKGHARLKQQLGWVNEKGKCERGMRGGLKCAAREWFMRGFQEGVLCVRGVERGGDCKSIHVLSFKAQ